MILQDVHQWLKNISDTVVNANLMYIFAPTLNFFPPVSSTKKNKFMVTLNTEHDLFDLKN